MSNQVEHDPIRLAVDDLALDIVGDVAGAIAAGCVVVEDLALDVMVGVLVAGDGRVLFDVVALPRQRRGRFVLPSVSALGLGVVLVADAGRAPVGLGIGLDHSR